MASYVIHFIEGPCDGQTRTVTQGTLDRGTVSCGGTVYVRYKAGAAGPSIVFVPVDSPLGQAVEGAKANPAHAMSAWTRWMRVLAHTGPHSHHRILRSTARARRIARHR